MRITADANVLIRSIMGDHPGQTAIARTALKEANRIAIPLPTLCELVWVLGRAYRKKPAEIAAVIRTLLDDPRVDVDLVATAAGLTMLDVGGGFADGVIAFEGKQLGGEVFVTFDRKAAKLIRASGGAVNLLDATS